MPQANYQDVLLYLLSLWEAHLAKLQGHRSRTFRRSAARHATRKIRPDVHPKAGALTKTEYLGQRIDHAVEPFADLLHESDLRFIKLTLEERLRTDPQLVWIAERAARRFR